MADYPEFTEEFTADMEYMVCAGRVYQVQEPLPSFHPDLPVGTVAHWDETRVIVRISEIEWQLSKKVKI